MKNLKSIKFSLVLIIAIIPNSIFSQTVTIGSGNVEAGKPYNPYYDYTYSQCIYDQSEIANSGVIDKIRFSFNGNSAFTDNPVNIYIGHTSKSTFSNTSDWIDISLLTQVYSGAVSTVASAVWIEIDITDFAYNNTDNLVVAVHEAQSGYYSSNDDYYSTACSGNKSIYIARDGTIINPSSPPTAFSLTSNRSNIQFVFGSSIPMTYLSSTVTQSLTDDVYIGSTDQEIACVKIVTSGSFPVLTLSDFVINMDGSTDPTTDVSNIEIFCTGINSSFSLSNSYGTASSATGDITISGSEPLMTGTNYFWITYDISAGATDGNFVDVECTEVIHNGAKGSETPTVTAAAGSREVRIIPPDFLMSNTALNTCYGTFFDTGGNSSNYTDNETYVKTICSDNGENIRFDFEEFLIQPTWDQLRIRDGSNTSATIIGTYSSVVPVTIISSGTCLTFEFTSDILTTNTGWKAAITCFDSGVCGVNPNATDLCSNAPLLATTDGICGTTGGYTATDLTGTNLQAETCTGLNFIDNNSWLQFTAASETVELAIICNCPGSGVEVSVFETSDCITFIEKGCYDPFYEQAPGVFKVTGLTIGNNYHLMVDQFSAAGCSFKINGLKGIVLPVELVEFKAVCNGGAVDLDWITASETNNAIFTIEKSSDGVNFDLVAEIEGAGNSADLEYYNFEDYSSENNPFYYRLKQTDFDGKFSYSDLVFCSCENIDETRVNIFPNPFKDELNISFSNNVINEFKFEIVDCFGRVISKGILDEGISYFEIDIDESIQPGVYTLNIFNDYQRFAHQVLKVK